MLTSYNHNPYFPYEECSIDLSLDKCPRAYVRSVSFPHALRKHFLAHGYAVPSALDSEEIPRSVVASRPVHPSAPSEVTIGSAFFITPQGHLLTNAHVVKDCGTLTAYHGTDDPLLGRLVASDTTNDLAIVATASSPASIATFRFGIRLGEEVAVFGYPLTGLLASGGNFTLGNVTALAGLRDDSRMLQISAPVQPGNSGGPLLDETGAVVGVIVSKLNVMKVALATSDGTSISRSRCRQPKGLLRPRAFQSKARHQAARRYGLRTWLTKRNLSPLVPTITEARVMIRKGDESDSPSDDDRPDDRGTAQA
jgi:S1-C subfamily serine protease